MSKAGDLFSCTRCLAWKPRSCFHTRKDTGKKTSHCKDCVNKTHAAYRRTANGAEKQRKWIENNKPALREYMARYGRERRASDPEFKLVSMARNKIWCALNRNRTGVFKAAKTRELLGCTPKELVLHLESMFLPGMSWENYGIRGWHVDHIKPCAAFDLTDPEQQKQCFNYKNLQPLWWLDNIRKGDRYDN
jgi:hypothetical protein